MSSVSDKQRWVCPGCQRPFGIAPGKKAPELCPECRDKPPSLETTVIEPPPGPRITPVATRDVVQFKGPESFADPAKARWKPLAVVLPQMDLDDLSEASEGMRERRYYADLAWKVTRFWFVMLFLPASLASFGIDPIVGFLSLAVWIGIFLALSMPSSGALRE